MKIFNEKPFELLSRDKIPVTMPYFIDVVFQRGNHLNKRFQIEIESVIKDGVKYSSFFIEEIEFFFWDRYFEADEVFQREFIEHHVSIYLDQGGDKRNFRNWTSNCLDHIKNCIENKVDKKLFPWDYTATMNDVIKAESNITNWIIGSIGINPMQKKKNPSEIIKRPKLVKGKTIISSKNNNFTDFVKSLKDDGAFIDTGTKEASLIKFFEGKNNTIKWRGSLGALNYFIISLIKQNIIDNFNNKWKTISLCFHWYDKKLNAYTIIDNNKIRYANVVPNDKKNIDAAIQHLEKCLSLENKRQKK